MIKETKPTVFVVDDDAAVRDSLRMLLKSVGLPVEVFDSAQAFLDAERDDRPGCRTGDRSPCRSACCRATGQARSPR